MSTRFYGYRIAKRDFPGWAAQVRTYFSGEAAEVRMADVLITRINTIDDSIEAPDKLNKMIDVMGGKGQEVMQLQLFDRRNHWIIRPLAYGYQFMNAVDREAWMSAPLTEIFYNDGIDLSPRERRLRPVVDRVNEDIVAGRYLLFQVLTRRDLEIRVVDGGIQRLKELKQQGANIDRDPEAPSKLDDDSQRAVHSAVSWWWKTNRQQLGAGFAEQNEATQAQLDKLTKSIVRALERTMPAKARS